MVFREEIDSRYQQIERLLSDSPTPPTDEICNGNICGLIERDHLGDLS